LKCRAAGGTHFKSRQAKNAYNVLVLYGLRKKEITFTGQPWKQENTTYLDTLQTVANPFAITKMQT